MSRVPPPIPPIKFQPANFGANVPFPIQAFPSYPTLHQLPPNLSILSSVRSPTTINVRSLSPLCTERNLFDIFNCFGDCSVRLIERGEHSFAFIDFLSHKNALAALAMDKSALCGRTIRVEVAKAQNGDTLPSVADQVNAMSRARQVGAKFSQGLTSIPPLLYQSNLPYQYHKYQDQLLAPQIRGEQNCQKRGRYRDAKSKEHFRCRHRSSSASSEYSTSSSESYSSKSSQSTSSFSNGKEPKKSLPNYRSTNEKRGKHSHTRERYERDRARSRSMDRSPRHRSRRNRQQSMDRSPRHRGRASRSRSRSRSSRHHGRKKTRSRSQNDKHHVNTRASSLTDDHR